MRPPISNASASGPNGHRSVVCGRLSPISLTSSMSMVCFKNVVVLFTATYWFKISKKLAELGISLKIINFVA